MNVKILIDCIVRQTTVLISQLATTGGSRAPLAHIAGQVFLELSRELDVQGVSRKVSADMFGMALRTYQRRIQYLTESSTDRGRSLWEVVLEYLSQGQMRSRAQVLKRFCQDDQTLVRGVLHDLTESGVVLSSGSGSSQVFRATTKAERSQMQDLNGGQGLDELIWAHVYREGPLSRADLEQFAASNPAQLEEAIERLVNDGRVEVRGEGEQVRYSTTKLEILLGAAAGWEAAAYDHYHALVRTICQRLSSAAEPDIEKGRVGGSTFTYDIWEGHPLAEEAYGVLSRFREEHARLYDRIEEYNANQGMPSEYRQVVVYAGQCVLPREKELGDTDDQD